MWGSRFSIENLVASARLAIMMGDGPTMCNSEKWQVGATGRHQLSSAIASRSWEGVPGEWLVLLGGGGAQHMVAIMIQDRG